MGKVDDFFWEEQPIEADCLDCGPRPGTGFVGEVPCGRCLSTGLAPVPLSDLGITWDSESVETWLSDTSQGRTPNPNSGRKLP